MQVSSILLAAAAFSAVAVYGHKVAEQTLPLEVAPGLEPFFRVQPHTYGWKPSHKPSEEDKVTVGFLVKQKNIDALEELFWQVSDPKSALYGNFLSFSELGQLFSNPESTEAIVQYLLGNGVELSDIDMNVHGEYVKANIPVKHAQRMFSTQFHHYTHESYAKSVLRTDRYALPSDLRRHVTSVVHLDYFPRQSSLAIRRHSGPGPIEGVSKYTTPQTLIERYKVDNLDCIENGATQALFESLGQDFSPKDLAKFQETFGIKNHPIDKVIGPNEGDECDVDLNACGEANLDVQYILAVAQNCPTTYWSIAVEGDEDPFVTWLYQVGNTTNPPLVHSISYGGYEQGESDPSAFSTEIMKFGLRGLTVVVSSGDDGVANFQARTNASMCGYYPSFPATSPYVLSVGATAGPDEGKEEIVCSSVTGGLITSGGGFSAIFDRPSYQDAAVAGFFSKTTTQPVAGYNAKGRGIPDVSLLGKNYAIVDGGQFILVSGTSASAPVVAGFITLINDERLEAGKKPLGFVNPALYSLDASVFYDITSGNNKCVAQASQDAPICCKEGFEAVAGWDPITGLGSPKYNALRDALLALP